MSENQFEPLGSPDNQNEELLKLYKLHMGQFDGTPMPEHELDTTDEKLIQIYDYENEQISPDGIISFRNPKTGSEAWFLNHYVIKAVRLSRRLGEIEAEDIVYIGANGSINPKRVTANSVLQSILEWRLDRVEELAEKYRRIVYPK